MLRKRIMDNTIFFKHYDLVVAGNLTGIPCIDEDHDNLHPFVTLDTQKIYLECLFCDYRITPGVLMYNALRKEVQEFENALWEEETDDT
jgi:hypothetical protein